VFEISIKNRLCEYLDKYNIISKSQFGFLKQPSTISAISEFIDNIVTNLNKGKKTSCSFYDLKKAFDFASYNVFPEVFTQAGILGRAQDLLLNYLCGRRQTVVIGKEKSTLEEYPKDQFLVQFCSFYTLMGYSAFP
jgi:hypothetical protein